MEMTIKATIHLTVEDVEKFVKELCKEYDCEVEEIDEEILGEFFEDHIKAGNMCNNLFVVEGGDTDGSILQECDCRELMDKVEEMCD